MHLGSTILATRIDPGTRKPRRGSQGTGVEHRARQRRVRVGVPPAGTRGGSGHSDRIGLGSGIGRVGVPPSQKEVQPW